MKSQTMGPDEAGSMMSAAPVLVPVYHVYKHGYLCSTLRPDAKNDSPRQVQVQSVMEHIFKQLKKVQSVNTRKFASATNLK